MVANGLFECNRWGVVDFHFNYAKQTQLLKSQINVNPYNTSDYENKSNWTLGENKPNTNPIKPNTKPIQTQFPPQKPASTPKTNPIKPNLETTPGQKVLLVD